MYLRSTPSPPASGASASPQHRCRHHLHRSISASGGRASSSTPAPRSEKRAFETELPSSREKRTPCWMPLQNGGSVWDRQGQPLPPYLLDELN